MKWVFVKDIVKNYLKRERRALKEDLLVNIMKTFGFRNYCWENILILRLSCKIFDFAIQ